MAIKQMSNSPINIRQAIQSYGGGVNIDTTEVKGSEALYENGSGVTRSIDFGLDMVSNNNGGMSLIKNADLSNTSFRIFSTELPYRNELYTATTDFTYYNATGGVLDFTTIGLDVGTDSSVNGSGANITELGFQTTHKKVRTHTDVKSVVFDIADNWGNVNYMSVRRIEFSNNGTVIPLTPSDYTAYVTSSLNITYTHTNAFDTTLSKIGGWGGANSWVSLTTEYTDQRLTVVLNTPITFDRIIINNAMSIDDLSATQAGIKTVKITTSTDAITDTTYGAAIDNSEIIFEGLIEIHPTTNTIDDKGYCGVTWSYNPATGFYILSHDGTGSDFPIANVTGKPILFNSTKSLDKIRGHFIYNDKSGIEMWMYLNTTGGADVYVKSFREMSGDQLILGDAGETNWQGERYLSWGFVGDDLGHLTPGMTGIEGSSALITLNGETTFDCGMLEANVDAIIIKNLTDIGSWYLFTAATGWNAFTLMNSTAAQEATIMQASWSGTNVTLLDSYEAGTKMALIIGKKGMMPSGQTINIDGSTMNPFVASIADGFSTDIGPKNITITEDDVKVLGFSEDDGNYVLTVDDSGVYSLDDYPPMFHSDPGIMKGTFAKLPIADVTVFDNVIVDIELMPVGNTYTTEWFPVELFTKYVIPNRFKDTNVEFTIWWSRTASDAGKREVTGNHYFEGEDRSFGAYKRIELNELIVGTALTKVFYSASSGDSDYSDTGYYQLTVRRLF